MASELREMTIAEELILLLLKDDTGFDAPIPEWRMSCALVGAVLLDLSFKNRIDADLEALTLLDARLGAGVSGVQGHADAGGIRRSRSAH